MTDISAFFAAGKRLSLDIKLHGIGVVRDKVQFESNDSDCTDTLVEHVAPQVIELLKKSTNSNIRELGRQFEFAVSLISDCGEPEDNIYRLLVGLVLDLNSSGDSKPQWLEYRYV